MATTKTKPEPTKPLEVLKQIKLSEDEVLKKAKELGWRPVTHPLNSRKGFTNDKTGTFVQTVSELEKEIAKK